MKRLLRSGLRAIPAIVVTLPILWGGGTARAVPLEVTITVDNSYALFTGTLHAATTFIGSDPNWPSAETYSFDLDPSAYIYVVTASDLSTAQGFLGQFTNQDTQERFYSSDLAWQVMATGLGSASAPYSGTAENLALLSQEIADANAGGNPSNGWVALTAGGANGVGPWGTIAGIDPAASWVWYRGGQCTQENPTIGGCDAGEWLVFRIAAAATRENPIPNPSGPPVPEPGALALTGLALLGLALTRFRVRAAAGAPLDRSTAPRRSSS